MVVGAASGWTRSGTRRGGRRNPRGLLSPVATPGEGAGRCAVAAHWPALRLEAATDIAGVMLARAARIEAMFDAVERQQHALAADIAEYRASLDSRVARLARARDAAVVR